MRAAYHGTADCVKLLISKGSDVSYAGGPNGIGDTPLIWAARAGNVATGRVLCFAGSQVNAHGFLGWTALMQALRVGILSGDSSEWGSIEFVKLLISHGAEIDAIDNQG